MGAPGAGQPRALRSLARFGGSPTNRRRVARDRRGRGTRAPVLPNSVPAHTNPVTEFDRVVVAAYAELHTIWRKEVSELDVAVDEVPRILPRPTGPHGQWADDDLTEPNWPEEVTADGPVPLARLVPAGIDRRGQPTRARLVLFRRPLQLRASEREDLIDLTREVLIQQLAIYLRVDETTIEEGPAGN